MHLLTPNSNVQLFFPALLQYRWVCYVWCLENNVIFVFDPSYAMSTPDSTVESHERTCYLLKLAMRTVSRTMFQGWHNEWTSAELRIMTWLDRSVPWWAFYLNTSWPANVSNL